MLLVIPEIALREIQSAIVNATHCATDTSGERMSLATIDARTLATAARMAVEIATGEVVWPAGEKLRVKRPKPTGQLVEFD